MTKKVQIAGQEVLIDDDSEVVACSLRGRSFVEFIGHALLQMRIRNITKEEALAVIRSPDLQGLPTEPGRHRLRRNKTVRTAIDVVFEELPDRIAVVTAIKIERRMTRRGKR